MSLTVEEQVSHVEAGLTTEFGVGNYRVPLYSLENIAGQPSDVKSLCIHGMLEDHKIWLPLNKALGLSKSLMPNFPWSAEIDPYWGDLGTGDTWVEKTLENISDPLNLIICHSFGCNAALELFTLKPELQPEYLVLISPFYRSDRDDVSWKTVQSLIDGLEPLIVESIACFDKKDRYHGEILALMVEKIRDKLGIYGWTEFYKLFLRSPLLQLEKLKSKVIIISGENDNYCPFQESEKLATAIPNAVHHLLPNAGHFAMITHEKQIAKYITDLIN